MVLDLAMAQPETAARLTRVTNTDGKTVDYTYDLRGKIATITSLQGTTAYAYDSLGILSSVTAADGTVTSYGGNSVTATVAMRMMIREKFFPPAGTLKK